MAFSGPSGPITETVILYPMQGVVLEKGSNGKEVEKFNDLLHTIKNIKGFSRQFYGHGVESPEIFVWCIDWTSWDEHVEFVQSDAHGAFVGGLAEVFDFNKAPPLILYSRWTVGSAQDAFEAPITEVAFYTLPGGSGEKAQRAVDEVMVPTCEAVKEHGKALGAACGWVFKVFQGAGPVPQPSGDWLTGVFGYESLEAHMKWREHPEMEKVVSHQAVVDGKDVEMEVADVPGINKETGWFHVKFQKAS